MNSAINRTKTILKKRFSFATLVSVTAIVAVGSFIGGTRASTLLAQFTVANSQNRQLDTTLNLSSVQDVYDTLRSRFDGKLDPAKLVDGAKKGLVEAAGDPYTVYFTDSEAKQFLSDLDGTFTGIGAELDRRDNHIIVVSTLDDSPAKKAGLQANDILLKVNDQDASTWSTDKTVSMIRGDKGTTVKLAVVRGQEQKEFSIVRDQIINPSVKSEVTGDNIGYLRISRFADTDTATLSLKAAEGFKAKNVRGVILDLRGNGGGYVTAARAVASLWLRNKVVVEQRRDNVVVETQRSDDNAPLEGIPTIVLVDGGSASASEIVSGALHDNNAATLVGQKTFGKGSVQDMPSISSGGILKVTIAKWYTPKGKNIHKEGIMPDVVVPISDDDIKNGRDPQKDKAIDLLKNH